MPEFLTQRNGYWHFVRRVPLEFAALDKRGVIKHSTRVEVQKDRRGTKAGKIADDMNRDLEAYWHGLVEGRAQEASERYAEARRRARTLGSITSVSRTLLTAPLSKSWSGLKNLSRRVWSKTRAPVQPFWEQSNDHPFGSRKSSLCLNIRRGMKLGTCPRTSSNAGKMDTSSPSQI